jgi:hypothetical protein
MKQRCSRQTTAALAFTLGLRRTKRDRAEVIDEGMIDEGVAAVK